MAKNTNSYASGFSGYLSDVRHPKSVFPTKNGFLKRLLSGREFIYYNSVLYLNFSGFFTMRNAEEHKGIRPLTSIFHAVHLMFHRFRDLSYLNC